MFEYFILLDLPYWFYPKYLDGSDLLETMEGIKSRMYEGQCSLNTVSVDAKDILARGSFTDSDAEGSDSCASSSRGTAA
jgi:hypothetical protein